MKSILSLSFLAGLAIAYRGDLTYYSTGLGSCGFSSTDSDAIVALSLPMVCTFSDQLSSDSAPVGFPRHGWEQLTTLSDMDPFSIFSPKKEKLAKTCSQMANGANPNTNPKCGSRINIHNPASGKTVQATVVDTCVGCATYDVDVSSSLFANLEGGLSAGRVTVDWGEHILVGYRLRADCWIEFQG